MATKAKSPKRLYRSTKDKKLAGVCGGLGEYLGVDSTLIRLAWVFVTLLTGILPGTIVYIVAAVVIPNKR